MRYDLTGILEYGNPFEVYKLFNNDVKWENATKPNRKAIQRQSFYSFSKTPKYKRMVKKIKSMQRLRRLREQRENAKSPNYYQ